MSDATTQAEHLQYELRDTREALNTAHERIRQLEARDSARAEIIDSITKRMIRRAATDISAQIFGDCYRHTS